MNFIDEFFTQSNGILTRRLQAVGFTAEQANMFLPEAASGILKSFQHKEIEHIIAAMSLEDPERLLNEINVNAIAKNIGMNAHQVTSGFEAIAPDMAKAFTKSSNGIVGAAASIAWGSTGTIVKASKKSVW